MYTVIASSIGSLKSIRKGRANTRLTCCEKPSFWRSYGAKYLSSPVSLRIFWARRTMMIGLDNVARQIGQSMVNGNDGSQESLWQRKDDQNQACTSEEGQDPKYPSPVNASRRHEAGNDGAKCRARERRESEEGECLSTSACVPDI